MQTLDASWLKQLLTHTFLPSSFIAANYSDWVVMIGARPSHALFFVYEVLNVRNSAYHLEKQQITSV